MPSLGADMEWGILSEWYVEPGQRVERGDVVGMVETRKGSIEVQIFESGVVEELVVEEGTKVPVGDILARLRTEDGEALAKEGPAEQESEPAAAGREGTPEEGTEKSRPSAPAERADREGRLRASPAARRRAKEVGVDLSEVAGTGPGGAVTFADVEAAAGGEEPPAAREAPERPTAGPAPEEPPRRVSPLARRRAEELDLDLGEVEGTGPGGRVTRADVEAAAAPAGRVPEAERSGERPGDGELGSLREAIADAMARSKREIPHYYLENTLDMRRALEWVEERNKDRPASERILPAALMLKAVALAAREVPDLNGFWRDGRLERSDSVHLGVGISLRGGGLVAPALHDVDRKAVDVVSRELVELVTRARTGRLRSSEVTDATLTVTNLGERGVEAVYGIIYPPQVALVGFGRITERPWSENGMLDVRPVVRATLSGDHRATDGHQGGLFLDELTHRLQHPEEM